VFIVFTGYWLPDIRIGWPEKKAEPIYRVLFDDRCQENTSSKLFERLELFGEAITEPQINHPRLIDKMVRGAIQQWVFPGDARLIPLLNAMTLGNRLFREADRQAVFDQIIELLARFRAHILWDEIENAQERHHRVPLSIDRGDHPGTDYIDLLYRDVAGWHLVLFNAVSIGVSGEREELMQDYPVRIARYRTGVRKLLGETFSAKLCLLGDGGNVSLLQI
jgi:hypothetical protein